MSGKPDDDMMEIHYRRKDDMVYLKMNGGSNHELRQVLVGLSKHLDDDDQDDLIMELQHYRDPDSRLSSLARSIAVVGRSPESPGINRERLMREEWDDGE